MTTAGKRRVPYSAGGLTLMALALLALAGWLQASNETRRREARIIPAAAENKAALEAGLMALGGFRGLLADMLWMRAISEKDAGHHHELRLLCDWIQKLQPTFAQVNAFQAFNMAYNLAARAETCEDKWYWVTSGLAALETGAKRNANNHALWFELGFYYFDRLGDTKMAKCKPIRQAELPRIDELNALQIESVFSSDKPYAKGRARPDEHLRFAAYFMMKSIRTGTDKSPLRTEVAFGQVMDQLGYWWPSSKQSGERVEWSDWGAEDWWVEVIRRNSKRGFPANPDLSNALLYNFYLQMDFYDRKAKEMHDRGDEKGAAEYRSARDAAYARSRTYFTSGEDGFPAINKTMDEMLATYRELLARYARERRGT